MEGNPYQQSSLEPAEPSDRPSAYDDDNSCEVKPTALPSSKAQGQQSEERTNQCTSNNRTQIYSYLEEAVHTMLNIDPLRLETFSVVELLDLFGEENPLCKGVKVDYESQKNIACIWLPNTLLNYAIRIWADLMLFEIKTNMLTRAESKALGGRNNWMYKLPLPAYTTPGGSGAHYSSSPNPTIRLFAEKSLKTCDYAYSPWDARFPSVVFETGYGTKASDLVMEAKQWLEPTNGYISTCIVARLEESNSPLELRCKEITSKYGQGDGDGQHDPDETRLAISYKKAAAGTEPRQMRAYERNRYYKMIKPEEWVGDITVYVSIYRLDTEVGVAYPDGPEYRVYPTPDVQQTPPVLKVRDLFPPVTRHPLAPAVDDERNYKVDWNILIEAVDVAKRDLAYHRSLELIESLHYEVIPAARTAKDRWRFRHR